MVLPSIDAIHRQDLSQPRGSATSLILSQPYFKNRNSPPLLPSNSPQPSLTPFCPTSKVSPHTHTHKPAIPLSSKASHIYLTNRSYMKTDFSDPGHPDSPSRAGNIPLSLLHHRAWCSSRNGFLRYDYPYRLSIRRWLNLPDRVGGYWKTPIHLMPFWGIDIC